MGEPRLVGATLAPEHELRDLLPENVQVCEVVLEGFDDLSVIGLVVQVYQSIAESRHSAQWPPLASRDYSGVGERRENVGVSVGSGEPFRRDDVPPDVDADFDGEQETELCGPEGDLVVEEFLGGTVGKSPQSISLQAETIE